MTEPSDTPRDSDVEKDRSDDVIEPEYETAVTGLEDQDPVTRRSEDPAAMSEHERNLRQAEQYGIQTRDEPGDPYPA